MDNKGMTLLEVILVIAILAILTAVCIPKNVFRRHNLYCQAKLLTNEIRMLRHKTMTEGGRPIISLNRSDYRILEGNSHLKTVDLGADISIVGINRLKKIRFNQSGTPRDAGSIRLEDAVTNEHYYITIVPYTGRILLREVD